MTGRPDFAVIADWVEGRLDDSTARRVAAEVAADADLQADAAWLRRVLAAADDMPLHTPPAAVSERLTGVYDDYLRRRRAATQRPVLRATLVFDSRRDIALAGVRGAATDDTVHLAYSIETAGDSAGTTAVLDVVVDAEPLQFHRVRLSGQLLPSDDRAVDAVEVTVHPAGPAADPLAATVTDPLGRFEFGEVSDAVGELRIGVPGAVIVAALTLHTAR